MFSFDIFLHTHSLVGRLTEILPGVCNLGPAKGLSSDVVEMLSLNLG